MTSQLCYATAARCKPTNTCSQKVCGRTAEKRFVATCLPIWGILSRYIFLLWNLSLHSLPEAWGSWEPNSTLHRLCVTGVSCPNPPCICRKYLSYAEKQRVLVAELWSPRFVTIQWLCSQLCYETAANQRTIVEIELWATVSWKWGCRPLSCRCSQNVTHCRKEICCTCLFKESTPSIPCGNSKHPSLPEAWGSWEPQHAPPALRYGCIMPIPSLQLQKKPVICREAEGFGHGVVVSRICYNTVIVLSVVLCDCCKPTNNCLDWAFSNSELDVLAASLSAADVHKMWRTVEKRFVPHVCLRNPFPLFLVGIPSIPPCQKREVPESRSMLHRLCVTAASCPSLRCSRRKNLSYAEKQRVWSRTCGLEDLL